MYKLKCPSKTSIAFHSRQQGRSETEEYSSDSESESEDEEELQMILEDLQKQNEELEVREAINTHWLQLSVFINFVISVINFAQRPLSSLK